MNNGLSRREFMRIAGGLTVGSAVAGCMPATPGSTPEGGAGDAPSSSDAIVIDFMNWWGAQREPLMDESIARFNELHPNIEVVNAVQPWDRRAERAATAIASSSPPGVIMTRREETYRFADEGLIVPFTEYVAESGLDIEQMFYASDLNNQRWQGELWSLPLPGDGGATSMYLYNKELLEQAGFDPESPPETWQELEEVARAVTEMENNLLSVMGTQLGDTGSDFVSWLYTNGGQYVTDDGRTLQFNSPEGVETLEWMVNFTDEINGGIENVRDFLAGIDGTSADFPFYQDRYAVYFTGTWAFDHLETWDPEMWADTDKWGVALRPYNGNSPDATHHGISGYQWGWGYVIPASLPVEVQEAAFEWVKWWVTQTSTEEAGGCHFLFAQSQISAAVECTENPAWYEINPYWDVVVEAVGTDVSIPITPVQSQISALLDEAVEQVYFGQQTPQESLDWAASEGQELLDDFWSES